MLFISYSIGFVVKVGPQQLVWAAKSYAVDKFASSQ